MSITRLNNNSITSVTALPSGVGGKVLQVQQGTLSSSVVLSNVAVSTFADTGLNVNITPNSSSNKILLQGTIEFHSADNSQVFKLQFSTDGSSYSDVPAIGNSESNHWRVYGGGSTPRWHSGTQDVHHYGQLAFSYLHTISSTNQHTYRVVVGNEQGNANIYINRSEVWSDEPKAHGRITISTIQAMEIAG